MTSFALRHLLESTLFCALLFVLARWFTKGAAARHAVGLVGVSKFVIPSLLLAPTGARLAFFWPAAPWLSSVVSRVSAVLSELDAVLPTKIGSGAVCGVAAIWAGGTAALLVHWWLCLRRGRHAFSAPTRAEENALAEALSLLPVRLPVRIATSKAAIGPELHGFWRPAIVLPRDLISGLTPREFQAVLLHELAHASRLDNLTAGLIHLVLCLFWFHPLLWCVESWLHAQRERACDEAVVRIGIQPRVYAAGLLKVCRFIVVGAGPGVSAVSGSDLKTRLESILEDRNEAPNSYAPRVLVAALGLLMTLVPVAGGYCSQCVSNGPPSHAAVRNRG